MLYSVILEIIRQCVEDCIMTGGALLFFVFILFFDSCFELKHIHIEQGIARQTPYLFSYFV